jgi:Rod binding domain-containing protein
MDVASIASVTASLPGGLNLNALNNQSPAAQRKTVAGQFEAILLRQFLNQSVGSMMGGDSAQGDDDGAQGTGDSAQGSIYGYLLTDTLAQTMAAGGGLGMAKIIEQQLTPRGAPAAAGAPPKGTS